MLVFRKMFCTYEMDDPISQKLFTSKQIMHTLNKQWKLRWQSMTQKNHKISNSGELAENGPKTSHWGLSAIQNSKIHQFLLEILLIKISCNLIGKTIWKIKNPFQFILLSLKWFILGNCQRQKHQSDILKLFPVRL